ncbi:MAG: phosphonoacetaldehyde hydrolase [Deltaproteobacteria bacterium]|nr:MAG: phosphonoacetaldehyde hydrolase [Deltaproteobacteria bacterium]
MYIKQNNATTVYNMPARSSATILRRQFFLTLPADKAVRWKQTEKQLYKRTKELPMQFKYTRKYTGPIRLVVFDWAGTTVDFGCQAPIAAFVECFKKKGIDLTKEQARGPMGMEKRDHIKAVFALAEVSARWQKIYGKPVTEQDIDTIYEDFATQLMKVLPAYSQILPGVVEATTILRGMGIKIAATTGYFREAAETVAGSAAQQGYIPDSALSSSEVENGRPAPWLIYKAMENLNIYPAATVINVGDTVVDIESGLNAGTWSIGVAATGNETGLSEEELTALEQDKKEALVLSARNRLARAGAHFVIETMAELPGIVQYINTLLQKGATP